MTTANAIDLSGQTVLISGAAGGIGAATARACGAMGAGLVLADVSAMEELAGELATAGVPVEAVRCDLRSRAAVNDMVRAAGRIDAIIACAGICPLDNDWLESAAWDDEFREVMDVNVLSVLHLVRAVLPDMEARGSGRMVLIGSIGGRMGGTSPIVQPHYIASKGGVHALVWWLAQRLAPKGILVNGIAPGPIATEMTSATPDPRAAFPLGRLGRPEEIAWPAAFLCSPAASYFSGAILDVNGGLFVS